MKPKPTRHSRVYGKRVAEVRNLFELSRSEFWNPLGVGQSAASRYENGNRATPIPVCKLIHLVLIGVKTRVNLLKKLKRINAL